MTDSAQFIIRNFQVEPDLPRLAQFRLAIKGELIDAAKLASTEVEIHKQMQQRNYKPSDDRWVVTTSGDPQHIIARAEVWAQTSRRNDGFIDVLPFWRRQQYIFGGKLLLGGG